MFMYKLTPKLRRTNHSLEGAFNLPNNLTGSSDGEANERAFVCPAVADGLLQISECGEYSGFQSATLKITSVSLNVLSSWLSVN